MLEPEQFNALLEQLKIIVKRELQKDARLWDLNDIAEYFKVSKGTVSRYRLQPDFPASIAVPYTANGIDRITQRYVPEDIKKWAIKHRAA